MKEKYEIDPILMATAGHMNRDKRIKLLRLLRKWCKQLKVLCDHPEGQAKALPLPHCDRFRIGFN